MRYKKLYIDFETRSVCDCDLKSQGLYKYARHPSTEILCMALMDDPRCPMVLTQEEMLLGREEEHIRAFASNPNVLFVAHNAAFEIEIWHEILVKGYGFPEIPLHRWRDTAAKAAAFALPRSLEGACSALGLPVQKNMEGHKLMLKFSKPQKKTVSADAVPPETGWLSVSDSPSGKQVVTYWHENPEDFKKLMDYCVDDVLATIGLDEALPDLIPEEQRMWELDQRINARGIRVDLPAIENLMGKLAEREVALLAEIEVLTDGEVKSTRQVERTIEWLFKQGVTVPDLTKATVSAALRRKDLPEKARRLLEIRQHLSKSSVSKLRAMVNRANEEGVIRGSLLYHGAATGRWAGSGIQPQNMPKPDLTGEQEEKGYEACVDEILELDLNTLEAEYGGIFFAASSALRGMIIPKRGNEFISSDFSAIESRGLGFVAREPVILDAYAKGLVLYKVAAERIYNIPYDAIEKSSKEYAVGKAATLALGYQGWVGAFQNMAKIYGITVSDEEAADIAGKWRTAHPMVVKLWDAFEQCGKLAIQKKGKVFSYNGISFGVKKYPAGFSFLHLRLPSGRLLSYFDPEIIWIEKNGQKKQVSSYMGVNGYTRKWERIPTYGGKWTENVVQAMSRDVLRDAMFRVEDAEFPVSFHVHDELVSEIPEGRVDDVFGQTETELIDEFESLMSEVPPWAKGFPIGASGGWIGRRYRK